ncbi:MAG: VIT family protein [Candidatus Sericytochromatia bacterium]|nr:VIT family protein [Candidatus Sericytochromatia bacterium]
MASKKPENHKTQHIGWLRAAVLGANDGIISTSSLIVGVASSGANHNSIMVAGIAALIAGAASMAAGEYVSVSSQLDTEKADIAIERIEILTDPESEKNELAEIYVGRGLERSLAIQVAEQLMNKDALTAHTRDELGISDIVSAKPIQAAVSSAAAFTIGASLPLIAVFISSLSNLILMVSCTSLVFLTVLGALAAYVGGANMRISAIRVTFWGALAIALTAMVGKFFGTTTL